jgi:hypothetical protein
MRAVTKGLIQGVAAAAQTNYCPAREAKRLSIWIDNLELAFQPNGAVVIDRDSRRCHFFS